jgi:hypothetical protein
VARSSHPHLFQAATVVITVSVFAAGLETAGVRAG